jgi:hypothetical protein
MPEGCDWLLASRPGCSVAFVAADVEVFTEVAEAIRRHDLAVA